MESEKTDMEKIDLIAGHYKEILRLLGEDTAREGLVKTPQRAAKALWFLTSGYRSDSDGIISQAMFEHEGSRMVIVRDIEFYSLCEHHILPFFGTVSVGYVPNGKIVGLSKIARIVNCFSRRLQVQERMTAQLCTELHKALNAKGVIVFCNAEHLCMKMRGVEKQNASTTTLEYSGVFESDSLLRREFMDSINR